MKTTLGPVCYHGCGQINIVKNPGALAPRVVGTGRDPMVCQRDAMVCRICAPRPYGSINSCP